MLVEMHSPVGSGNRVNVGILRTEKQGLVFHDDHFTFILLSRESGGGAMRRMNPDSLGSCLCFQVFRLNFLRLLQFAARQILPSKDNHREASYPWMQQRY